MKSFIDLFLEFTKDFESPTSFWRWSAYAAAASVLRDNVHIPFQEGGRDLYPNIFTILVAKSGGRKDAPVDLAGRLVSNVRNTKVLAGRTSIEAMVSILASTETSPETGKPITGGSCLLVAPELASFFVKSDSLVPVLTDMYAFKDVYDTRLVGRETAPVKRLCVTMLAASNEPMLKEVYSMLAVSGGTLRRTFIVKPDEVRPANALFLSTEESAQLDPNIFSLKGLLSALAEISKFKGPATVTPDAAKEYKLWYMALHKANQTTPDPAGVRAGIHTGVKKLALILAASKDYTLEIGKEHIELAITECMNLLPNYDSFVMSSGKGSLQEIGTLFLNDLWIAKDHKMTKRDFLSMHWGAADDLTMERLQNTFEQSGFIKVILEGPSTIYIMADKGRAVFEKHHKNGASAGGGH